MRQYRRQAAFLWGILAIAGLGLLIASLCLEQQQLPWTVGLFLIVCLAVQILLYRTAEGYMRELATHLSDLIDQLTQLREEPVFPPLEDTVLSRLQQQVERLASIWAGQNQQAKRDRDEIQSLVSDLSHQLKTPVATLQIYGALLTQPDLSPKQRQEYGARMSLALERLDFLLDSMVKLSRLETESIHLHPRAIDVEELVLNAGLQVRKAAEEKNMDVSIQPPSAPIVVCCDPKWTEEAIFNILDNAVKYTPQGGRVILTLEAYETYCRINISDTGCGIPREEIPKIFQRFYRGRSTQNVDGAGLGLALARKILQKQGGWIQVTSGDGGSTFSAFLRRADGLDAATSLL